jgi:hypothetical protein
VASDCVCVMCVCASNPLPNVLALADAINAGLLRNYNKSGPQAMGEIRVKSLRVLSGTLRAAEVARAGVVFLVRCTFPYVPPLQ